MIPSYIMQKIIKEYSKKLAKKTSSKKDKDKINKNSDFKLLIDKVMDNILKKVIAPLKNLNKTDQVFDVFKINQEIEEVKNLEPEFYYDLIDENGNKITHKINLE